MFPVTLALILAQPGPPVGKLDNKPASRFAVGDEREQAVTVRRRSAYQVSGNAVVQAARYTLTSRLAVTEVKADGGAVVKQTVTAADLGEADPTMRASLADALKQAVGTAFEFTVGPTGCVTEFRGPKDALQVQQGAGLLGPTLRVWAVLDADAWKELAGLTVFAPEPEKQTWDRPLGHDWGPLGSWAGRTHFTHTAADRVTFRHALSYRPPAAGGGKELPVTILQPRFAVAEAGGTIRLDGGRVVAADETFRVRGAVTVLFAGQAVGVELEEAQAFEVRLRRPGDAVLKAGP